MKYLCYDNVPRVLWSFPHEQPESDCACSDTGFAPITALPTERATAWQIAAGLYRAPLPNTHELAFTPVGLAGVVVLNKPVRTTLDEFAQPHPLDGSTSRQLAALQLLQPHDAAPTAIRSQPRTLTAWLHVTNACNLRCTYCYLAKTGEAMDETTGRAAISAVFRSATRHGFRAVKLKYAGGEATLNFQLVRTLHEYAHKLAARHGLDLREVVLSNGVALTNQMLDFIRDTGMRLSISLDGLGPAHDAQRIFANGRGTSKLVALSVDRALDRGVKPYLSITLTKHNAEEVAAAVAFALDRGLLFNLNFYRDNNYAASHEDLVAEDDQLIVGARAAFKVIEERLPRYSLIGALVDRASFSSPHDRPCGAGHNYLVIDHNGRVAGCQMEIERTVTDVMSDDPLQIIRESQIGFRNVSVDEKEGCRGCEWRYWCAGGCPLLTYRVTGRSDVKSPYCNVYRTLYPDVLRLEGLRMLKWKAPPA